MSYFCLNLAKRVVGTFQIFQYVNLLLKKQATFNVAERKIIVPRTTFDFELDARISQRSYIRLGDVFKPLASFLRSSNVMMGNREKEHEVLKHVS